MVVKQKHVVEVIKMNTIEIIVKDIMLEEEKQIMVI